MLSGRLLSEITKINRQTGEIMWRLGGKENQFTFTNDEGFSYQHDIRRLPNGHITLFDNGNQHSPPHSRAVEYEIDETNKVITKVWEYRQTPDIFQFFMGDVQRLPNGNTFIGWGGPRSLMTEVGPDGSKRLEFEIDQPTYGYIYRAYRFPWEGNPVTTPTLVLTNSALYMSWNGATGIQSWDVESSHYPDIFTQTTNITRTGFESSIPLANLAADACYFRVKPQRTNNITRYSDVVALDSPACGPALSLTRTPASQVLLAGKSAAYTVTLSNIGATPLRNLLVSGSTADCDMALTSLDPGRDLSYRCAIPGISQSGSYSLVATADRVGVAPVSLTVTATNTVDVYDANPTLVLSDAVLSMIWPNVSDIVSWTLEYSQIPRVFTQSVTVTQGLTQTLLPLADVPADACYFRAQPQRTSGEGPFSNVVARSDGACGVGLKLERTPSHQVALKYSAATYTVTLVNTGTVFLHNIVVTGSLPGCNLNLPNLAPNERVTYQCAVNKISENLTHTLSVLAEARPIDLNMGESGPIQVTDSNVAEVDVIQFFYPLLFSSR